jgi:hypothetical protein
MNDLREKLVLGMITREQFIYLYGEEEYKGIADSVKISLPAPAPGATVDSTTGSPLGPQRMAKVQAEHTQIVDEVVSTYCTNRVLEEYLKGLEARFVPFRRYHLLTSDRDIVSNNIVSSEHNVGNAVSVTYYDYEDKTTNPQSLPAGTTLIKASTFIPEAETNIATLASPNCRGYTMALRYGMGQLIYELREMYRGELLVYGNPRIRCGDVCILLDDYNQMAGPVEVQRVTHLFSHETGFLTEIKPGALVFGNEISTWPVIEALKLFIMAVKDNEKTPLAWGDPSAERAGALAKETRGSARRAEALAQESHTFSEHGVALVLPNEDDYASEEWKKHLAERYGQLFAEGVDLSRMFPDEKNLILRGSTGGFGAIMSAGKGLVAGALNMTALGLVGASFFLTPVIGVGLGGVFYGLSSGLQKLHWSSLTWLVAGSIIFAKCLENEAVAVVPLEKNGIPIVSGLSYKDPMALWRHIRGNVTSFVDDTIGGTEDLISELRDSGMAAWRSYRTAGPEMKGY